MAVHSPMKLAERFRGSLEQAQARLSNLEEEAQKVFQDVVERSKAPRKEMANIIAKINTGAADVFDTEMIKQWQVRAKNVSADFAHRLDDLRVRAVAHAGVATRQQVDELARGLDKLSRKIDRLLGARSARSEMPKESKQ